MAKQQNPASELRGKNDEELAELLKTTKSQLFEARFQNYTNRLDQTSKIRSLRRQLARVLTVTTERRNSARQAAATSAAKSEG
jgi:large subunit ribosomal protein L29